MSDAEFLIESIRLALGKIARQASVWPPQNMSERDIIEAVTDASAALVDLEKVLGVGAVTAEEDKPPEGYIIPEGDERCGYVMDACTCMKRKGHDGLHACAHGGWRAVTAEEKE